MTQQNSSYQQALRDEEGWHDLSDRAAKLRERAEQLRHEIKRVQHVEYAFQKSTRDGVQALQFALENDPTNSELLRVCVEQSGARLQQNDVVDAQTIAMCGLSYGCGDALRTLRALYVTAKTVDDIKNDVIEMKNVERNIIRIRQNGLIRVSDIAEIIDLGRRSLEYSLRIHQHGLIRGSDIDKVFDLGRKSLEYSLEYSLQKTRYLLTALIENISGLAKQHANLNQEIVRLETRKLTLKGDEERLNAYYKKKQGELNSEIQTLEQEHERLLLVVDELNSEIQTLVVKKSSQSPHNIERKEIVVNTDPQRHAQVIYRTPDIVAQNNKFLPREKKSRKVSQYWLSYSVLIGLFLLIFLVLGISLKMILKSMQSVVAVSIPLTSEVVSTNKPVEPTDEPVVLATVSEPTPPPSSITSTPVVPTTEPTTVSASTPPLTTVTFLSPNEPVTLDGWMYTLPYTNSSFFLKELDGVLSSKGRFVVVLMRVINENDKDQSLPPGFFQLRDDQGKTYPSRPDLQPYTNERAPISDSNYRRLVLVFDVPADATGFSIASTQDLTRGWPITPRDLAAAELKSAPVDSPQKDFEGWNYDFSGPAEVEKSLEIGGNPARVGYTFVVIRVRIMNGTNRSQSIDPFLFVLRDATGGVYLMQQEKMVTYFQRRGRFTENSGPKGEFQTLRPDTEIPKDDSTWGLPLVFEVPQSATGLMLMNPLSPTTAWDIP